MKIIVTETQIKSTFLELIKEDDNGAAFNALASLDDYVKEFNKQEGFIPTTQDGENQAQAPYANVNQTVAAPNQQGQDIQQGQFTQLKPLPWLDTVSEVWRRVFVGPVFNGRYSQNMTAGAEELRKVGLRRATKSRADCSGFVFTCLQEQGLTNELGNTQTLSDKGINGFEKRAYDGNYQNLPAGTILSYSAAEAGRRSGHTVILGETPGTGWSFGGNKSATSSLRIPLKKPYKWAFIPKGNLV